MAAASSRVTMRFAPTIPPNAETESHMNARRYAFVISLSEATPDGFWCLMIATVGCGKSVAIRHAALPKLVEHRTVPLGPRDDNDMVVVLRAGAQKRDAANVDLVEEHRPALAGRGGLGEGVEVHDDEVDRLDPLTLELFGVLGIVAPG